MAAQAGWYVDPRDARQYRYWDGDRWSQSTQPIPELADAASVNGASGSLSAGGAKDPVGADAFDQAPAQPTDSDGEVLADFMWTSGFGETPDDPAANAGPAMFTPGSGASAPPAPAAPVAPAPIPPVAAAPVPPIAAAPVPPVAAAPVPPVAAAPVPPIAAAPVPPIAAAPTALTPEPAAAAPTAPSAPAQPLFQPPAAAAPVFGTPAASPTEPSATPDGGSPFAPPSATGGAQFDPAPAAAPTAPEARAGGSLFAPIDPSLQPIFGAGDQPSPASRAAVPDKKGRKGRGKSSPAPASEKVPPPPSALNAAEPFRMPEQDPIVPRPDVAVEPPSEAVGAVKVKADRKADRAAKAAQKPKGAPGSKEQKGNESKSKVPILLGALGVVVLGAAAFLLLSGGDDEGDTSANVAGTTVEKTSTTVAPATTAAPTETTAAAAETTAAPTETTVAPAADPAVIAGFQTAFDAEATRACDVIKADPGILTEDVIKYDAAWAAIPKTYQDLQKSVNECTFQARDEALKRVAALEAANGG